MKPVVWAVFFLVLFSSSSSAQDMAARQYLDHMNNERGFIIHIDCDAGDLIVQLGSDNDNIVQGLDRDSEDIAKARANIRSHGDYGRISTRHFNGKDLPYIDNTANLIIAQASTGVARKEIVRVLQPLGVAFIDGEKIVKPWPDKIDEWTHYLHDPSNNAVADDDVVAPPQGLQWVGKPLWSRSHTTLAGTTCAVSAKGRIFTIEDRAPIQLSRMPAKYTLIARDAFNGIELWRHPLPNWEVITHFVKATPVQLTRRLVAVGDRVYATLGITAPVSKFDARTGEILRTYSGTNNTQEIILFDNALYLIVGDRMRPYGDTMDHYRVEYTFNEKYYSPRRMPKDDPKSVIMEIDAVTGRKMWEVAGALTKAYQGTTLAVNDRLVFFQTAQELVCLDREKGSVVWKKSSPVDMGDSLSVRAGSSPTLVLYEGKVFVADGRSLKVFSQDNGETIWETDSIMKDLHYSSPDVLIAGGAVWMHHNLDGYDLDSGAKIKVRGATLEEPMGHDRCYRNKATNNYIINSKSGGADFSFLGKPDSVSNAWVRGTCELGIIPCNGLLYASPHACSCVNGTKLNGFYALNTMTYNETSTNVLEKGPAYDSQPANSASAGGQWPTYRQEVSRSGNARTRLPSDITRIWRTRVGTPGALTVADNKVFVSDTDGHGVCCLSSEDGKTIWRFMAGARVDLPPTYYRGKVFFGSRDGWVYCLAADTGDLCWRFRAAPNDMMAFAIEQPESLWPVHGSVLVLDGTVYFVAGRSSFLNKGLYIYGLDPATGKRKYQTRIDGPYDEKGQFVFDRERHRAIKGNLADILVSDGELIYLRHMAYTKELKPVDRADVVNDYIITVSGFLDDTEHDRSFWTMGKLLEEDVVLGTRVDADMLVVDGKDVYGFLGYPSNRHPKGFNAITDGFKLFSLTRTEKRYPRDILKTGKKLASAMDMFDPSKTEEPESRWEYQYPENWSTGMQLNPKAMLKSAGVLYIAGVPNEYPDEDIYMALEGRMQGLLATFSATDGSLLTKYQLDAPPVWDSLAAADERLFISLKNGYVECWSGK